MGTAQQITLPDQRTIGFDDVGDPSGVPVLYVHGSPDSRRSRHPDDTIAASLGIRLIAVDRPGSGLSTVHPTGTVGSFADDALALADHLDLPHWRVMAWSAGAPFAVALAARHPDRVHRVAIAAGLVPFSAYAVPGILDDADDGRHMVAELGAELGAAAMAAMAAPLLAPYPCDLPLALEHVLEGADPSRRATYAAIPGSAEAMALGVADSVVQGLDGLVRDLELQVEQPDVDLSLARCPVDLWYGAHDHTAPPAFGRWWAEHLPDGVLTVVPQEGHLIALTHWQEILRDLAG